MRMCCKLQIVPQKHRETGAFTALIEKIELKWSGPIFIEQVLSERFAVGLLKLGFVPVNLEDQDFCGFPRHFVKKLPI